MKKSALGIVLALLAPFCASAAALDIPAQPLGASLEALSKQVGVYIQFEPGTVALLDAPALKGTYSPEHALDTLLARTELTYHVKDRKTITIARAVDEVVVSGRYEKLSAMREEYVRLEDRFYETYNRINTNHQWDVNCQQRAATGTRFESRVCMPVFVDEITHEFYRNGVQGNASGDPWIQIQFKRAAFRNNLYEQVNKHPELLELLMKRNAAAQRYYAARAKKFAGGRFFVVD